MYGTIQILSPPTKMRAFYVKFNASMYATGAVSASSDESEVRKVAIDGTGQILLAGFFKTKIQYGSMSQSNTLNTAYLARYAICTSCSAGSYSATINATSCTVCPTNTYNALAGQSSSANCLACPYGTYTTGNGTSAISLCVPCAAGSSSVTSAVAGFRFGSASSDNKIIAISSDSSNNVYMIGSYTGSVTFGSNSFTSASGSEYFVLKQTSAGSVC